MNWESQNQSSASKRILERELEKRISLNSSYSKRAFAKQLGIAPSFLSNLINGRRRITTKVARRIAEQLSLSDLDRNAMIHEATGDTAPASPFGASAQSLGPEIFEQLCSWWYVGILEFLETNARSHAPEVLAQRLGISKSNVAMALQRLERLGVLERDPKSPRRYRKTADSTIFSSQTPNEALRSYHSQLLEKAKEAIYFQSPEEKIVGSMTIAFDPNDLPEIRKKWIEFRKLVETFATQGKDRDSVYTMVFEFFALTRKI
jgi:transcriptional regulator with XRE-family HTH domain